MTSYQIPFNRPAIVGREWEFMQKALEQGKISGDGYFTNQCQELLERELDTSKVLLTTSCTHALDMVALLLDIGQGDEVIIPSYTFVSAANAFVLRGATPVFCDIRPDTKNIDESRLERLITSRTRAIVLVHYAGVGCEMDAICHIAQKHRISIVEDNAHGLFGKYRGRWLGSFGSLATLSFHETKNFTCGEGGALILNEPAFLNRAEIIREKGTNRSRYFRGEVDKYTWVDIGSSFLPSDLLAAFLLAQLQARDTIQSRREQIWRFYWDNLQDWAEAHGVLLPVVPHHCEQSYHMFYLVMPSLDERQAFIQHLKNYGIFGAFHYVPLHLSDMGRRFGGKVGDCPVAEEISDRLVRLPFYNSLTLPQQEKVVETVQRFYS